MLFFFSEEDSLSFGFSSLLSNALSSSEFERLFSIAFVFTVETGFIPTSLVEHFDSVNSNIELAKMINALPLNSFWHQNNNIFNAQLVMSNQLCNLTGIPCCDSLIVTLCYSNISKCTILEDNLNVSNNKSVNLSHLSVKYKNSVSVPIKCSVLAITIGHYPGLCGIPEELVLYVMTKLDPSDLYLLMRCCKKMNHLATNNQFLWKQLVTHELKKETANQMSSIEQPIIDWRNYYFELRRKKSGRRKIMIVRE